MGCLKGLVDTVMSNGKTACFGNFGLKKARPRIDVEITIFCDFCQFSAKKMAFLSKTNVMITFFQK
jgi:hypothetical protein